MPKPVLLELSEVLLGRIRVFECQRHELLVGAHRLRGALVRERSDPARVEAIH
jgi:hypothetical protein